MPMALSPNPGAVRSRHPCLDSRFFGRDSLHTSRNCASNSAQFNARYLYLEGYVNSCTRSVLGGRVFCLVISVFW